MKKKVSGFIIFIVSLIVSISLVSASYSCSNGSSITEDLDEINVGEKQTINGLGIGLIESDDIAVFDRFTAELMIDAKRVSLDNQTNSEEIELLSGSYNISFVNATDDNAKIKVGSNYESIEKKETREISDLKIFLVSTEAAYPNAVILLAGKKIISLSSDENPSEIVTIGNKDYAIELYSASDSSSAVRVKKCETGDLIEIKDPIIKENNETNNANENTTNLNNQTSTNNQTPPNNTIQQESNNTEEINRSATSLGRFTFLKDKKIIYYIAGIVIVAVLIFLFFIIRRSKEVKELKKIRENFQINNA